MIYGGPTSLRNTALVTGAGGRVGSRLARTLVAQGYYVKARDDLSGCGTWHRLDGVSGTIELVEGDVLDATTLERSISNIDVIFHFASLSEKDLISRSVPEVHAVNTTATLQLLGVAQATRVFRLIFGSSCAVYGRLSRLPINELECPMPLNAYAASKLAAEHFVTLYAKQHGLKTISLRCADTFDNPYNAVAKIRDTLAMITRAVRSFPDLPEDHGRLMFDLCHVDDIVEAALLAAQAPRLSGEVVNIGSGSAVTFREIAGLAPGLLGSRPDSDDDFSEISPAHPCCLDITSARKLLGYNPKVQFGELIRRTLSRLRMNDRN